MKKSKTESRIKKVKVKTAKRRSSSSTRWLQRQLNDPYVAEAKRAGYRSRAAFKLKEVDDKYQILKPGGIIVDLGAAPGSWMQVAAEKIGRNGKIIGLDLLDIKPLENTEYIRGDFMSDETLGILMQKLEETGKNKVDVVLSDMAPNATGHKQTDHLRIMALLESAYDFATQVLKPGGSFLGKTWQGGAEKNLLDKMKKSFAKVVHIKPKASRPDSAEMYVLGTGFRG